MFRIYYADGSTYDGPVEAAPGQGVIIGWQSDPDVGFAYFCDKDFYVWDGYWLGVDLYGLYDYLARPGWKKVLAGQTVTPRTYSAVFDACVTDPDKPEKSARLVGEARP